MVAQRYSSRYGLPRRVQQRTGPEALVLRDMQAHGLPVGEAQPPLSALQGLVGGLLVHADHLGILRGVSAYNVTIRQAAF